MSSAEDGRRAPQPAPYGPGATPGSSLKGMKNAARLLAALGLLGSPLAFAQVHKCVDAGGNVTYQEAPCPPGVKAEPVRTPVPAPVPPPAEVPASPKPASPPAATEDAIERLRQDCLEGVMRDGRTGWERVAAAEPRAGAFPQQEFQASAEAFCGCVAGRVKGAVAPAELAAKGASTFAAFGTEALQGGQCAPTGAWARLNSRQF
jgi:Domain of unknown function (DUF4124)